MVLLLLDSELAISTSLNSLQQIIPFSLGVNSPIFTMEGGRKKDGAVSTAVHWTKSTSITQELLT